MEKKKQVSYFFPMFKAPKPTFPLGTFIPTPMRIVVIIHLCIAFSALLFVLSYPFMGQLFETKSDRLLYESVINKEPLFTTLSVEKQLTIQEKYQSTSEQMQIPFSVKLKRSFHLLLIQMPPFQKAWIFFSILLPILMLLKIEGAATASWLLPVITIAFVFNHLYYTEVPQLSKEHQLFPTEEYIVDHYIDKPLSSSIIEQQKQLRQGWNLYLITEWAKETPSADSLIKEQQIRKGEFLFNVARVDALSLEKPVSFFKKRTNHLVLFLYIVWNIFFAWFVNRRKWN